MITLSNTDITLILVLACVLMTFVYAALLEIKILKKRISDIEENHKVKCPYQEPSILSDSELKPCFEVCPVHRGICYRWALCLWGKKKKEQMKADKKKMEERV